MFFVKHSFTGFAARAGTDPLSREYPGLQTALITRASR
jgi:hypothetical protein